MTTPTSMLSRLNYTFRETWASFRRNMTLTVAAIITSAVSLLIFGLTLLMQQGFDNLLVAWQGDVEMIVFVNPTATDEQRAEIQDALSSFPQQVESFNYCDTACSLSEAQRLLAGDPSTLELLTAENIPTQYKVVPTQGTDVETLRQLRESLRSLPNVSNIVLADEQLSVIDKLKGFVGLYTLILSVTLLFAAILLIWNTIRTAMFARRREIEVMKLVGATDWFIRVPFMLEGLIQGFIGGLGACGGLWAINNRWTAGVQDFPQGSGFAALVVTDGFTFRVMLLILAIGMVAGAIGSGIAASRFLDV
ncbi:MAG: permease-like cell division protein FtsX [Ilumatobacteraceae bacterium]